MKVRRIQRRPPPDPALVGALSRGDAALPPVLARVYAARATTPDAALTPGLEALASPHDLKGLDKAVDLLETALEEGQRVVIVGDYDADGATSCALLMRGLRAMGLADVSYRVPDRFRYGYGLSPEIVAEVAVDRPRLLITVDNGISSLAGVAAAQEAGMKVLITDHHLPGETLPAADAIVNPNQPGCGFPSRNLAGVGVAFYLLSALRARLRARGWFAQTGRPEPNLGQWLDLVALGTVADVVPLDANNRILVEQGLKRIRAGRACPGILALLRAGKREPARCVASDLGFAAGPRLNAAGRLEDMTIGIECLLADEPARAIQLASRLDALNRERRDIEARMQDEALAQLDTHLLEETAEMPWGLCLFDADWHPGVVGIVASRIKERFHRPVIAFAPEDEKHVKGSARSMPGLHIRDALDAVAAHHPGLISRFGGHAMAAGLSLRRERLADFEAAFDAEVRRVLSADDLEGVILSDGPLEEADMRLELAEAIRYAGPWGQGFPEPVFDGVFMVVDWRVVGERHVKMTVSPEGGGASLDAIAFNQEPLAEMRETLGPFVHLAYRLDVNEYMGRRSVQLMVEHMAPVV